MLEATREESSLGKMIVLSEHTFSGFILFLIYYHFQPVDLDVERAFYFYKPSNTVPRLSG